MTPVTRKLAAIFIFAFLGLPGSDRSAATAAEPATAKPSYLDPSQPFEARTRDLMSRLTLEEKAMLLNHKGSTVERFGILQDRWNQCLHGVWWTHPTTMFPVSIAAGATWD